MTDPIWSRKNNKTLGETLAHRRYSKIAPLCSGYESEFGEPLGLFLLRLQRNGSGLYQHFLNADGDSTFSDFKLSDSSLGRLRGLYLYRLEREVVYVGRCLDSFAKRINQGYGQIHPKNCYIDGQRTNCRLNALVTANRGNVEFFACPLDRADEITAFERDLLRALRPSWNKQLA